MTYTTTSTEFSITLPNQLVSAAVFNHESASSYDVAITATDRTGLATTKSFTINIVDVAEAPVFTKVRIDVRWMKREQAMI